MKKPIKGKPKARKRTKAVAKTSTPRKRDWKPLFIVALRVMGKVSFAAQAAGVERQSTYQARRNDEEFARQWDEVIEERLDGYEKEIERRAFEGWEEPVYQRGEQVGTVHRFDSALAMFYLKAKRPEFRDRLQLNREAILTPEVIALLTPDELRAIASDQMTEGQLTNLIAMRRAERHALTTTAK